METGSTTLEQTPRWFAVHTRHQHEQSVARALSSKGFSVFLPTYDAVHRWTDRKKYVKLPLFPGYLFFANEIGRQIHVLSTPGVNAIIKTGNVPAEISNDEIIAIRRMVEAAGYRGIQEVEIFSDHWWSRPGDEVLSTAVARFKSVCG